MTATRKRAAILVVDVAGFSRLTGADGGPGPGDIARPPERPPDPWAATHGGRIGKGGARLKARARLRKGKTGRAPALPAEAFSRLRNDLWRRIERHTLSRQHVAVRSGLNRVVFVSMGGDWRRSET
jgi:hypothetical protein